MIANYGRVTMTVLDEVIPRLIAMRDRGEICEYELADCSAVLMGVVPADGDGFSFTADWARDDYQESFEGAGK